VKSLRKLRDETRERGGFWARIWAGNLKPLEDVINTWLTVLEDCSPDLALAETIEVQSLSGQTVGLIVLPSHPLRLAWHQAYDQLARHARYEKPLEPKRIIEALQLLNAEHVPSILPGLEPNQRFVYADMLGFQATAMVSDQDPEPKAAVARMLKCLGSTEPERLTSGGLQISHVLGREITRYIEFHDLVKSSNGLVLLHAFRPGDSATVARALGTAFEKKSVGSDDDERNWPLRFNLELFPADPSSDVTGSFLVDLVERNRTGAAGIVAEDRWMLQSQTHPSGLTFPRLRWARKDDKLPTKAAHLAIAFDSFQTEVAFVRIPKDRFSSLLKRAGARGYRPMSKASSTRWRAG
jgi:DNA phosphorothioation-dependent restriction protein DptH